MSTKALKKELLVAVVMLLVAAVALSGSTYAWFAMNNTVSATGMNVTTQTGDNLLIAKDTLSNTAKLADNLFKTALVDNVSGLLEPVSAVDGKTFYYNATTNTDSVGDAIADTYLAYDPTGLAAATDTATYANAFSENYGVNKTTAAEGAVGYVDYVFQLKAINGSDDTQYVDIDTLKLTYGNTTQAQQAFRVAIFVDDMGVDGATPATNGVGTLLTVLRTSTAKYFSETLATPEAPKAVVSTTALGEFTSGILGGATRIGSVAAHTNHYFKVVVRLWLEGEDTTCNNTTFATLNDAWALDLTAKLETANSSVTALSQTQATAKVDMYGATAANADTIKVDDLTFYPVTGKQVDSKQVYTTVAGDVTAATKYYVFDTNNKPFEVTNQTTYVTP